MNGNQTCLERIKDPARWDVRFHVLNDNGGIVTYAANAQKMLNAWRAPGQENRQTPIPENGSIIHGLLFANVDTGRIMLADGADLEDYDFEMLMYDLTQVGI